MRDFFKRVSPVRAMRDLLGVWHSDNPHRWPALGVAMAATFSLFMLFIPADQRIEDRPPEVTWITTFAEDRTPAQIIASNCRNHELKQELEARLADREEFRRDMYRALGRATFIDVDAIEREVAAERASQASSTPHPVSDDPMARMSVEEYCSQAASGGVVGAAS
jgi:hypothetical protein